jgi:streptogramin lyase
MEDRTVPSGAITEFGSGITAGSGPVGIAAGPDDNLWFTELHGSRIGRITPQGTVTEFSAGIFANSYPAGIAAGPDGNFWFTEFIGNRIGRITPQGAVTEFSTGISANSGPSFIAAGPDGNLWFTEYNGNRVGRITPQGTVTEFGNGISANSGPFGITAGPDGNLWFTERDGNRVGRITPQGTVTEFSTGISAGSFPYGIAAGPDGNLWFTESDGSRIGRITPQGTVTEFSAGISADSFPYGIAAGPEGNLWFTDYVGSRIGRITPQGTVTEFSIGISAGSSPAGITAGPDGNLWFTESDGNRVAKVQLSLPTTTTLATSASPVAYGQPLVLTATVGWSQPFDRPAPSGLVSFFDGTTLLGAGMLSNGQTFLTVNGLAAGVPHNLTARYAGDPNDLASTSPVTTQQVIGAATATILSAASSSTAGDLLVLSASVTTTDSPATPVGYVTFYDGGTLIGVANLSGGLAAVGASPSVAGTHHLTAHFTPAPGFQASQTAAATDLAVSPAAAAGLAFTGQPTFALSGKYVRGPVTVAVEDKYGNVVTGSSADITLWLAGPGTSDLTGTLTQTAINGVVSFPDLTVIGHGRGFTLAADSPDLTSATSRPFAVSNAVKFRVTVSGPVRAGKPFTVTVSAVDSLGRVDPYYLGSVDLTGIGLAGQTSGTFGPKDRGKKRFTLTLPSAGKVAVTVTDSLSAGVFGKLTLTVSV